MNDVRSIDETYNRNYLRAEYNFVHQSAQMAAKWEHFAEDGDRFNIFRFNSGKQQKALGAYKKK